MLHGRAPAQYRSAARAHSNCASQLGPRFLGWRLLNGYVALGLNGNILAAICKRRRSPSIQLLEGEFSKERCLETTCGRRLENVLGNATRAPGLTRHVREFRK